MPDSKKILITIDEASSGLRLDKVLSLHPEILSRSQAAKLISIQKVQLTSAPHQKIKSSYIVTSGEVFSIELTPAKPMNLDPLPLKLDIAFEDDHILIVNKPCGLVTHPAHGHEGDTLVNALFFHNKTLAKTQNEFRPGIVHRLDKDTSGLLVVAKTEKALVHLAAQFKAKTASRTYWALVLGKPKVWAGRIESALIRHPKNRKKFCSLSAASVNWALHDVPDEMQNTSVDVRGKRAITDYKTLALSPYGVSHLECNLETGRTHQIRVHLSEQGHPILGDVIYGNEKRESQIPSRGLREAILNYPGLSLHAKQLKIIHPESQQEMIFEAPLPEGLMTIYQEANFEKI